MQFVIKLNEQYEIRFQRSTSGYVDVQLYQGEVLIASGEESREEIMRMANVLAG